MQSSTPTPKKPRPLISPLGWVGIVLWLAAALALLQLLNSAQLRATVVVAGLPKPIPLGALLNTVAQVVMIVALLFGWRFARVKDFRRHRRVQTTVVMVNWLMILFVMGVAFFGPEVTANPQAGTNPLILLEIGHGIVGMLAALSGAYLVFRMVFERALPSWFKVRNFKRLMQITIVVWLLLAVGGLGIFGLKYLLPSSAPAVAVVSTPTPQPAPPTPLGGAQAADTPEPTEPPPTPGPTPSEVFGIAAISDDIAYSDRIDIDLVNVPPAPPGLEYAGWLIGNQGEFRLSVGLLDVGLDGRASHSFTSPIGENLFALYDEFIMTLEPLGVADDQPSADIKFSAVIPEGPQPALRALLVSAGDTPGKVGLLLGLRMQAEVVRSHVQLTDLALGPQDLAGVRRHAEHLINAIQGLHGPNFGDVDGDGRALNPGDTYGLLSTSLGFGYIEAVAVHAQTAIDAPDATEEIKTHAEHTRIAAMNALTWAEQLNAKALELVKVQDIDAARALFEEMRPMADALLEGVDADGDGQVEPIPDEGTIFTAYQHAQFAASPAYNSPLLEGGAPIVVAQATPTPTPLPPTATLTPEPQVVQVLMKDFVFNPSPITIKAGTTVEFINLDNAPHTATLDGNSNSKDTGTLNLNDKAALVFDTPGEYPYFCLFHGGPGGAGMAAKIVVEP
ncbi:MAG TPA: DUF420 domain-containing protein [Anaerolineae bacterium]|nr:DUF420 domain-containing protein [Anaerolineae bacterium]